jgi:hypothetical protein
LLIFQVKVISRMTNLIHALISYLSNFIINESLLYFRILAHIEFSTKILKERIFGLEKMVRAYQTNMDEFERIKYELFFKCKGENAILKVQIQTLQTENRAIKINDELRDITILDLKLVKL